jgi:hypothetical protein
MVVVEMIIMVALMSILLEVLLALEDPFPLEYSGYLSQESHSRMAVQGIDQEGGLWSVGMELGYSLYELISTTVRARFIAGAEETARHSSASLANYVLQPCQSYTTSRSCEQATPSYLSLLSLFQEAAPRCRWRRTDGGGPASDGSTLTSGYTEYNKNGYASYLTQVNIRSYQLRQGNDVSVINQPLTCQYRLVLFLACRADRMMIMMMSILTLVSTSCSFYSYIHHFPISFSIFHYTLILINVATHTLIYIGY